MHQTNYHTALISIVKPGNNAKLGIIRNMTKESPGTMKHGIQSETPEIIVPLLHHPDPE